MVSSRAWFVLAVAGVLGLFYVGGGLRSDAPSAIGQEPQEAPAKTRRTRIAQPEPDAQQSEARTRTGRGGQVGRYQLAIRDGTGNGSRSYLVVCDTITGRCWVTNVTTGGNDGWRDLGGPGAPATRTTEDPSAIEAPRLKGDEPPPADLQPRIVPPPGELPKRQKAP